MARGQATAIGAVFLVIIIALSLSYVVWAIAQIEELNRSLVKAMSVKEKYGREELLIEKYEYYEYSNISYSNVEGSFTATCLEISGEEYTQSNTIISDPLNNTTLWQCKSKSIGSNCTLLIFTCLPTQVGFRASVGWIGTRYGCGGWGEWGRTSGFYYNTASGDKVYLYLDYIINNIGVKNAEVNWLVKVCIETPGGDRWYKIVGAGQPVDITDAMVYNGTYRLRIYGEVNINIRRRGYYVGELRCNRIWITVNKNISTEGVTFCKTNIIYHFNPPLTPLLSSFIMQGTVDKPVELCILYYDNASALWRYTDCFLVDANKTFNIRVGIDPDKAYKGNEISIMLSLEGSELFELSVSRAMIECGFLDDEINITIMNPYSLPIRIVSIWIINSTRVWRFDRIAVLLPGESETFELPVRMSLGSVYMVRVVTERGNIFDTTIKT